MSAAQAIYPAGSLDEWIFADDKVEALHFLLELAEEWDRPLADARATQEPAAEHRAVVDLHAHIAAAAVVEAEYLALVGADFDMIGSYPPATRRALAERMFVAAGITDRMMAVEERFPKAGGE